MFIVMVLKVQEPNANEIKFVMPSTRKTGISRQHTKVVVELFEILIIFNTNTTALPPSMFIEFW